MPLAFRSAFPTVVLVGLGLLLTVACASGPPPSATELGWRALEAGDWRTARAHFATALEADAADGRAWHGRARAELAGRDPEAALRSLGALSKRDADRFARAARPTYAAVLEAVVPVRLDRKQSEAALQAARALAQLEPARAGLAQVLGRALLAQADHRRLRGHVGDALALYREACQVVPERLEAWVGAAEILLERRQGKQAIRLLERARRLHPTAGQIRTLTLQAMRVR